MRQLAVSVKIGDSLVTFLLLSLVKKLCCQFFVLTIFVYFSKILCKLLFGTGYACHCSRQSRSFLELLFLNFFICQQVL